MIQDIIVMGAGGRMGSLITRLVKEEPTLHLLGVVEKPERRKELPVNGLAVADKLEAVAMPGATVIDFTAPDVSLETAAIAAKTGMRAVIGTTGLTGAQKSHLEQLAATAPLLWSANMSVGVNVLLSLLPQLAAALGPNYDMEMVELHHRHKKDAPSGTALMLAESLAEARGWQLGEVRKSCRDGLSGDRPMAEIGVAAVRGGDVAGIHSTYFLGPGEFIEVKHVAESRENFANGAIRAAQWLNGQKPGRLYSMLDVIGARPTKW